MQKACQVWKLPEGKAFVGSNYLIAHLVAKTCEAFTNSGKNYHLKLTYFPATTKYFCGMQMLAHSLHYQHYAARHCQ